MAVATAAPSKDYWPSGTKVSVAANLLGVPLGGGSYGKADVTTDFTIARSQIVKADTQSFRMVVIRDGQQVMDVPASYGLDSDPNRNTRSGIHVVTEKFTDKRMVSAQYDYDLLEKWAVRISNNGEFIHANPDSASAQGSSNVSRGCVNLSITDAKTFWDSAMYGDPVEVTGSGVDLSPRDGDIYDWAIPEDLLRAVIPAGGSCAGTVALCLPQPTGRGLALAQRHQLALDRSDGRVQSRNRAGRQESTRAHQLDRRSPYKR